MTEATKPLCFVIMPFGEMGTENHDKYKLVYEEIIRRPLEEVGFACVRGDEIPDFGPIPESIKNKLSIADLVVADLSERNPNVYYELGFRHACDKPTLSISNDLKDLPFDISTYRTVLYRYDDFSITNQCRITIKSFASEILNDLRTRGYLISEQKEIALPKKKISMADLNKNLTVKLSNIYQVLGEIIPKINKDRDSDSQLELLHKTIEKLVNDVEIAVSRIGKNEGSFSTDKRFSILKGVFENGVEEIFKRRDDAYKKIIDILPNAEKRVDIMGISLRRFFHKQIDYNTDIKRILENHKANWRIMVIDPESEQALFRSLREEESTYNNMIREPYLNSKTGTCSASLSFEVAP